MVCPRPPPSSTIHSINFQFRTQKGNYPVLNENSELHQHKHPTTEAEFEEELDAVETKANNELQLYAVWGVITVVFNVVLFYLLYHTFHVEYQVANLIDWFFSVLFAFVVNKFFVFKHKTESLFKELTTFYGTRVATYLIEFVILWIGISLLGANGTITKVIGHGIAIAVNYVLSKLFVFKKKETPAGEPTSH